MAEFEGHDSKGRFKAGNRGGRGRHTDRLKKALEESVTVEDIQEIAEALKDKAKDGDIKAAELLLNRLLGKPAQNKEPEPAGEMELGYITFDDDEPELEADALEEIQWDTAALEASLKAENQKLEEQRKAAQG